MGGVILVGLLAILIILLITPALRARAREKQGQAESGAHETVVSRLEDHRRRKQGADVDPDT